MWPLNLIHASGGAAFTQSWKACLLLYRQKCGPPKLEPGGANPSETNPSEKEPGPDALRWQYAIARAHQVLEQWPQALAAYDAVLALEPNHVRALVLRALVLHQLDRRSEAMASLEAALAIDPANATALANRARLLLLLEDGARAESALRSALAQQPDDVDLLFQLAALVGHQKRPVEAIELWRQLLRQDRHHIPALLNLGGLLMEAEQFPLARSAFLRVLKQEPNHSQALFGLGQCQEATGDAEAALATYTRGLSLDPTDLNLLTMAEIMRLGLTLWDGYDARMQQLTIQLEQSLDVGDPVPMAVPMRLLSFPVPLELPRTVASCHASEIAAAMAPLGLGHPANPASPKAGPAPQPLAPEGRPLRIGYLSADIRCHAMGGLIHGLFAQHDRSRCSPIGYMLSSSRDRFTRSVAKGCERLRDVSQLGSEAIAKQIQADGIDVLVDLMGYTHQGRPRCWLYDPHRCNCSISVIPAPWGPPSSMGSWPITG